MLSVKPISTSIPEQTRRVAHSAFPQGNVYIWLRDELEVLYQDEDLPDRKAADAERSRIDWKQALGLELKFISRRGTPLRKPPLNNTIAS